ncbi:MAG: hypothetical protein AAGF86_08385 [Pseudomonadota bacterium]
MRICLCLVFSLILAGCLHQPHSAGGLAPGAGCPPLKHYSRSQQDRLNAELKACGSACAGLSGALSDYYVLRQQVRACRKRR